MIISFDLDDTLFISPRRCPAEPQSFYSRVSGVYLRKGTVGLLHRLQEQGAQVWVYTTSFRSEGHIRTLFRSYGIRLDGVVNGIRHARQNELNRCHPNIRESIALRCMWMMMYPSGRMGNCMGFGCI